MLSPPVAVLFVIHLKLICQGFWTVPSCLQCGATPEIDDTTVAHLLYGESQILLIFIARLLATSFASLPVLDTSSSVAKPSLNKVALDSIARFY